MAASRARPTVQRPLQSPQAFVRAREPACRGRDKAGRKQHGEEAPWRLICGIGRLYCFHIVHERRHS